MSKHKAENSNSSIAGNHNNVSSGTWCNIDMEIIAYFRNLSLQEKVQALSYMIEIHESKKGKTSNESM